MRDMDISDAMIEAAKKEFWRVLAIKSLTLDDAWRSALGASDMVRLQESEAEENRISQKLNDAVR